jgi:hypothetical protein
MTHTYNSVALDQVKSYLFSMTKRPRAFTYLSTPRKILLTHRRFQLSHITHQPPRHLVIPASEGSKHRYLEAAILQGGKPHYTDNGSMLPCLPDHYPNK